ncbi:MAG: hypothetical protein QM703_02810 [Gemmatales bacterium]
MSIGSRRRLLALEYLEDRTVPAKLANPSTVVFQDIDGDLAQLVFSKPVLTSSNVNSLLGFSTGAVDGSTSTKQSLNTLTLVPLSSAQGNNLSIALSVAKKSNTGDGRVNLGWMFSDQKALNTVSIQGDLGSFYLSNAVDLYCLQQLQVQSLGRVGGLNGSQYLDSAAYGKIGTIKVTGNVAGYIRFSDLDSGSGQSVGTLDIGGSFFGQLYSSRGMGTVRIGRDIDGSHPELSYLNPVQTPGSMIISGAVSQFTVGGSILGGDKFGSGQVFLGNDIQAVSVKTLSIAGNVQAGNGYGSGELAVTGAVTKLTIGGSIIGGPENFSGRVQINGAFDAVINGSVVGGAGANSGAYANYADTLGLVLNSLEVKGNIVGGAGDASGSLYFSGKTKRLIMGSLIGGDGMSSGYVNTVGLVDQLTMKDVVGAGGEASGVFNVFNGTVRLATLGNIQGGLGTGSGLLDNSSQIIQLVVQNLQGGEGDNSGQIKSPISPLTVTLQSVIGGNGASSGRLFLGDDLSSGVARNQVRVLDSVTGGNGYFSGSLDLRGPFQFVLVQNALKGGSNTATGYIEFHGPVAQFTVGSMVGGSGYYSGSAYSSRNVAGIRVTQSMTGGVGDYSGSIRFPFSNVTTFAVSGNIQGGLGAFSGSIYARSIENSSVGGSILGGSGYAAGGILADTHLGNVYISHDLIGSESDNGGYIAVAGVDGNRTLDTLYIGGSMNRGLVFSQGTIGSITVKNSITGTALRPSTINVFGYDQVDGVAYRSCTLGSLTVGKDMELTNILVGTDGYLPDGVARVGTVNIGRNWIASNIVVGYGAGLDNELGTADDIRLDTNRVSSIDSIFIQGSILGLDSSHGEMVIQAGLISSLRVGKDKAALNPGAYNDDLLLAELLRAVER